jgi:rod shape-determining protein MreB
MHRWFNESCSPQVAVDLGTANTRVYVAGRGLIADQPTRELPGRSPFWRSFFTGQNVSMKPKNPDKLENLSTPLSSGVIKDVDATVRILCPLLKQARSWRHRHLSVLACTPGNASADEEAALREALRRAGASRVFLIKEAYAAAVGSGIDLSSPYAQMLVDLGDGVADLAVMRSGEIVFSDSLIVAEGSIAGEIKDLAVKHHIILSHPETIALIHYLCLRRSHSANSRAEYLKISTCSTESHWPEAMIDEMTKWLNSTFGALENKISSFLRKLPDREAAEIIETGICLTGGGACFPHWPRDISMAAGIEVHTASDPLHSVIWGAKKMLSGSCH